MPRNAVLRFLAAFAVLVVAWSVWRHRERVIERPEAEARASKLLAAYIHQTGQPGAHFGVRRSFTGDDGWDFVWSYRPCADTAELRITIARSGAAHYAELPDCAPHHGLWVRPLRV